MGGHDVAQICPNGHVANDSSLRYPQFNQEYCSKCGEKTIKMCSKCGKSIQGLFRFDGPVMSDVYVSPSFCKHCGQEFPWTERKRQAAIDLFLDEIQEEEERKEFRESVEQISKDTPQAQVASTRIVRLLKKVKSASAKLIKDIVVEIASEAAKKGLFPGG